MFDLVVIILAGLPGSLLLVELVLRFISSRKYYVWLPRLQIISHVAPGVMPGIEGESKLRINQHGLRGDPFSQKQTYRILVFGGSATECLYLDDTKAWPYLTQTMVNERTNSTQQLWIGNIARGYFTSRNLLVQFEKLTQPGHFPKINAAMFLIGAGDMEYRLSQDKQYRPFPGINNLSSQEFVELMNSSFEEWPDSKSKEPFYKRTEIWNKIREIHRRYFRPPPQMICQDAGRIYEKFRLQRKNAPTIRDTLPEMSGALKEYSENINSIIELGKKNSIRVIFLTTPCMWRSGLSPEDKNLIWTGGIGNYLGEKMEVYYSIEALAEGLKMYNDTLKDLCRTHNVECVDLEGQLPKDSSVFYDDAHFNEKGSRKVASIVSDYLIQKL